MAATGVTPSREVAALSYEVADKAFSGQAEQLQELRGRVAMLVTVGPAAAAVIVAATSPKFDLLALLALLFLAAAVAQSVIAIWRVRGFHQSPVLPSGLPAGTDAITLQLALARKINELRELNTPHVKTIEQMFFTASASFLVAVVLWSVHAATNSKVLFVLG